jgi:hypothetical protein
MNRAYGTHLFCEHSFPRIEIRRYNIYRSYGTSYNNEIINIIKRNAFI